MLRGRTEVSILHVLREHGDTFDADHAFEAGILPYLGTNRSRQATDNREHPHPDVRSAHMRGGG